jgi:hydrogenase maturation protein HypF
MPRAASTDARRWLIGGRVQGVGFRPFVCLLANELGVNGSVRNEGGHVEIVAQHRSWLRHQGTVGHGRVGNGPVGNDPVGRHPQQGRGVGDSNACPLPLPLSVPSADEWGQDEDAAGITGLFLRRLLSEHPPIARPELISAEACERVVEPGFHILPSTAGLPGKEGPPGKGGFEAVLLPDQSVCGACLTEMADPNARRYRYPFITCTQCGPRFTIAKAMPFDRASTVMAEFPLCARCRAEYEQPADRRFHAQVMACPDCGPTLSFWNGMDLIRGNKAALARTIAALRDGAIVAVKGIGGYHLLCDARDDAAVLRLRARKRRPAKPLAVLFPPTGTDGLDIVRTCCAPSAEEAGALRRPDRPIVLVPLREASGLSPSLAPGLCELGAMLPYSPLHHLIAGAFGGPLVATSGNVAGEPVLTEPADSERLLASVADAFLHHDRPILRPADDGVVRVIAGLHRPLRLGRGSAPLELTLSRPVELPLLALGGQMKVTMALAFGARVVISPHLGEIDSPRGLDLLEATAETLQRLHGVQARTLICDSHDGYTSSRWAKAWAEARGDTPVLRVSHHRAHAAAVAGEFPEEARWLCFTWDGVGLGEDGTLWGGEALLGHPGVWARVATFRPFAPPGGDKAAREPWRSAAALAWELGLNWEPPVPDAALVRAAWASRLNSPETSSVGRLFDAAAAFLRLVQRASHEGEGPMALETIAEAESGFGEAIPLRLSRRSDGVLQADWAPLVALLLDETRSPRHRAAAFHASLARCLVDQAITVRHSHGAFAVGLTGGVFQNRLLAEMALHGLREAGLRTYLPIRVPCNDAGLSFGQIIEAAARIATPS